MVKSVKVQLLLKFLLSFSVIFVLASQNNVFARSIFELEATVDGQTETEGFDNIFDFVRGFDTSELTDLFPNYTRRIICIKHTRHSWFASESTF